jgi:hypothetical protein
MKNTLAALAMALLVSPAAGTARDDRLTFSIKEAISTPAAREKLHPGVAFYFGSVPHPEVAETLGQTVVNLKTNAFGKSDLAACQWVFLSVLIDLQKRAREAGGNAVIDIESYYKKEIFKSETQFMCGAGATIAGVAFRGTIVKLRVESPAPAAPTPAAEGKPATGTMSAPSALPILNVGTAL